MGIWGDVLGFAGDLLNYDLAEDSADDANRRAAENVALQREFAQHGVTWRVADAQRAGLHPLFALSGGGAAFAPNPIVMDGGEGAAISRAARSAGSAVDAWLGQQAALDAAAAATRKDNAISSYYESMAARGRQAAVATKPAGVVPDTGDELGFVEGGKGEFVHQGVTPVPGTGGSGVVNPFMDRRLVKPSEVVSHAHDDESLEAATGVAWKRWTLDKSGFQMVLPGSSTMSESLEALSESKVLLGWVIAENVRRYGAKWMTRFMQQYGNLFKWD